MRRSRAAHAADAVAAAVCRSSRRPSRDALVTEPVVRRFGGLTRRSRPATGLRPTVLFTIVLCLNVAWVGFGVWVSGPWRDELEAALGPVMGWVIPILLAYVPGFVIGFMLFTLLVNPYRELELVAPPGPWPPGRWPAVTVLIAARNEADAIGPTIERIAALTYPGPVEVVLADNGSTDRTADLRGGEAARRLGLDYRRVVEAEPGKAPCAQHGARNGDDADSGDGRRGHDAAARVADLARRPADERAARAARLRLRRGARGREPARRLRDADAAVGLPARDQRREADAGRVQHRARRPGCVLGVLDGRPAGGGRWPDAIGEDIVLTWAMLGSRGSCSTSPWRSASRPFRSGSPAC